MKKITFLICLLFAFSQMNAQLWTINSCSAELGTNTYGPMSSVATANATSRTAIIYPASQLATLTGMQLTNMYFKRITATGTMAGTPNFKIYLKEVSNADWGAAALDWATATTGATLVYDSNPVAITGNSAGWKAFPLTGSFTYSGTQNLAVFTEYQNTTASTAMTWSYEYTAPCISTTNNNTTKYSNNTTATYPTSLASANYRRPLIGFDFPVSCPAPTTLTATGITANSVNLGWVSGGVEVEWAYVVQPQGTGYPTGSGTQIFTNPYTAGGLNPSTNYEVYVRANCGVGDSSFWTGPINFTTLCLPITVFPYLEQLNTFLPNICWTEADNGDLIAGPAIMGSGSWLVDGFGNVGTTGAARVTLDATGDNDWIISPEITIPAIGYEFKFDAAATQGGATTAPTTAWESDDFVEVLISTTGTTNWSTLYTYNDTNSPSNVGTTNIIDLDAYAGQTVRLAYRAVEGATNGAASIDFSFDNFEIRLTPTCPDVIGLTVGNITGSTADTSWGDASGGGAIGYEYAITTSATPPASGTQTTNTFYAATGLNALTVYYLHVRAECTGSTYGNWSTTTFTTGCAPITVFPHLEPFATYLPSVCWTEGDGGDITAGPTTASATASSWLVDGFGNIGTTGAARVTLDAAADNDWIISPEFTIPTVGYELKHLAAATQGGATTVPTTAWESDDYVEVLVTSNGTTNWSVLYTYNDTNVPSNTGSLNILDLDAFSGQTVRFAFRAVEGTANGAASIDFSFDNFEVRLSPPCPDQTGLVVSNVSAFTADTSWGNMSPNGAIGYEYAITTSATPPASGTSTTNTFYAATGLTAQTVYYLHVRSECSGSTYGTWSTISFTTACAPIVSLPWIENFDTVTTPAFPPCWFEENGDWVTAITSTYNTPHSGANYLRDSWSATNEYMWTPGFDLVAGTSYDFSSWIQGDGYTGWTVDYFVNSTQNSVGAAQLGAPYAVPGTGTIAIQPYAQVTRSFVPATSGTYYFAFRVNQPSATPWYVAVDDVELKLSPSCPTPSASASSVTDATANLAWAAVPSATLGYEYVLDNVATDPAGSGTSTMTTSYGANSLTQLTTYYFHIRSVCSAGTYSTWSTISFTTFATPPVNDNLCNATVLTVGTPTGITNTLVGATSQTSEPVPACFNSGINGSVWFSFISPASGSVEITTDFAGGTLLNGDTEISAYAATGVTCSNLTTLGTALGCDQDGGTTVNFSSFLSLAGLTAGNTYYVQVDRWGTATAGTFGIQVTEVLSSNSFDTSNFVAYPNPVKDVLNLSYKTAISNVRVVNLLGQEVLNTKTNTNDVQVNMSALTAGAYVVTITVEDTIHTIKVIKE